MDSAEDTVTRPHPREQARGGRSLSLAVALPRTGTGASSTRGESITGCRQPARRTRAPRKSHRLPGVTSKRTGLCTLGPSEQHWLHFPRRSASGRPHVSRARCGHTLIHSRAPARRWAECTRLRSSGARGSPSPGSASEPPAPAPEPWYDLCPHTGAPATAVMATLQAANAHQEEKLLEKQ